jgi:hypothetical protein
MFFTPPPGCYLNLTVNRIDELSSIKNLPYFFYRINFECGKGNQKISYTCVNYNKLNLPINNYTYIPTITDYLKKDTSNLFYDPLNIKINNYIIAIPKIIPISYNLIEKSLKIPHNFDLIRESENKMIPDILNPIYSPVLQTEILYLSKEFLSFDYSKERITSDIFGYILPRCTSEEEKIYAYDLLLKILLLSELDGNINDIQFIKKTIKNRHQEYSFIVNYEFKAKIIIGPDFLPRIFYKKIGELKYLKL